MNTNKLVITADIKERWKAGNFTAAWTLRGGLNVLMLAQISPVDKGTLNGCTTHFPEHADTNSFPFDNKHTLQHIQTNYLTKLHLPS